MECSHLKSFNIADKQKILNPERWKCSVCGFTESVWACLECCNMGCGRFRNQHAQLHNLATKHPIALEINTKYLYCYECDQYLFADTEGQDVQELRELLQTVTKQSLEGLHQVQLPTKKCIHMMTRSQSIELSMAEDKEATAICHYENQLIGKHFTLWRIAVEVKKAKKGGLKEPTTPPKSGRRQPSNASPPVTRSRKTHLYPGVVGLRNLGNTCYMNSVLQVLSHVEVFRTCFLNLAVLQNSSATNSGLAAPKRRAIQSATDNSKLLTSTPEPSPEPPKKHRREGLSGGGSVLSQTNPVEVEQSQANQPMARELYELLRTMWSGKWVQYGPHSFLNATWQHIPDFMGHKQQDAQEFLSMLVSTVKEELTQLIPRRRGRQEVDLITKMFQGQLVSTVTCTACNNKSSTLDAFYDLSLEFPTRYQKPCKRGAEDSCHITEMLAKFTAIEDLGEVYKCEHCNSKVTPRTRSKGSRPKLTSATKQLLVRKLPQVLWLHLKRFRWVGVDRQKIAAHVEFDEHLDLSPYTESSPSLQRQGARYRLCGVVIHHGTGFAQGHYTALCWNSKAGQGSWVNFNDDWVRLTTEQEVLQSQAYILVYCRCLPKPAPVQVPRTFTLQQVDEEVTIRVYTDNEKPEEPSEDVSQPEEVLQQPENVLQQPEVLQQPDEDLQQPGEVLPQPGEVLQHEEESSQTKKKRSRRSKT